MRFAPLMILLLAVTSVFSLLANYLQYENSLTAHGNYADLYQQYLQQLDSTEYWKRHYTVSIDDDGEVLNRDTARVFYDSVAQTPIVELHRDTTFSMYGQDTEMARRTRGAKDDTGKKR